MLGSARIAAASLAVVLSTLAGSPASARAQGVTVHELGERRVRVDGMLRDWNGIRFIDVGEGDDASFRYALAYREDALYVAATVADQRLVRSGTPGSEEDALVLTLAMPEGRRWVGTEVWLYAGVSGRSAAAARVGRVGASPRPSTAVEVVEGPRAQGGGYVLEARVPWTEIASSRGWREGGRVAIRLRDVDLEARREVEAEPASAEVVPHALDRLPRMLAASGEEEVLRAFQRERNIGTVQPRFDLRGDVAGDGRDERVVVVDRFVVVLGAGYREGRGFDFLALPIEGEMGVTAAELRDVTNDGKEELLITLRQRNAQGARDLWQVVRFDGRAVQPVFAIELRKETSAGFIQSRLRLRPGRREAPSIEVRLDRAEGLTADGFREAPATDAEPILLPWGEHASRTYRWDGTRFAPTGDTPNRQAARERPPPPPERARPAPTVREPLPSAPSVDDLIALARRQHGVPARARPRVERRVNLAADRTPEHLVVFGRTLIVAGPGFRDGTGYFAWQIPLPADEDLLELRTDDLTGDGRAEVIMRIRQVIGEVTREVLLVHRFTPQGFPRALALEVARSQGEDSVHNEITVLPRGGGLRVAPGRARGWSQATWPYADGGGEDGFTPLLLPWRDRAVTYRFRDGAFRASS